MLHHLTNFQSLSVSLKELFQCQQPFSASRMLDLCGMPVKENDQQLEQLLATITKGIYPCIL